MRVIARLFLAVALVGTAAALSACANSGSTTTPTVTMTPAQVGAEAQAVLNALESSAASYMAANPALPAATVQKIQSAETAAQALVTSIGTANTASVPAIAVSAVNAVVAVADALPAGTLPPAVQSGLVAFQVLVSAICRSWHLWPRPPQLRAQ